MNREEQMAISALRYALGRQTYIVDDTIEWIKARKEYSKKFIHIALQDISSQLDSYPDTPYKEAWQKLYHYLAKQQPHLTN